MFKAGRFDVLEIPLPAAGMNQQVAPEVLPLTQAYILENIIPLPLGKGQVRHGTKTLPGIDLPVDCTIQEVFSFTKADSHQQLLLYVQGFKQDTSMTDTAVVGGGTIRFTTDQTSRYLKDTPVQIIYEKNGTQTLYADIKDVTVAEQTITLQLEENSFPIPFAEGRITSVWYPFGKIYLYEFSSKNLSLLKEDLAIHSVPRSVFFKNHLILCNGVNKMMTWNGETLQVIEDFVAEQASKVRRIDNKEFSFTKTDSFEIQKYQNNNLIQLKINGVMTTLQVVNAAVNADVVTLTTQENLPAFDMQDQVELFYRDFPPAFSYLFVFHNRLWALGEGPVGLDYRKNPMTVYFAYRPESFTHWFDERSKKVPYIDIAYKHGKPDNLEAIAAMGENVVFLGRHQTQVWRGTNPLNIENFHWQSTLDGGIVHGNLLVPVANDVFFISPQGLMSFGTLNVAKQFALSSLQDVDPLIRKYLKDVMLSNKAYRRCRSFDYEEGPFVGFKLGQNKTLVAITDTGLNGWSLFSGDFNEASSFHADLGTLLLAVKNKVLKFEDGKKTPPVFQDQGKPILFAWTLPVLSFKAKKFACKWGELVLNYPSSFVLNDQNTIKIQIYGNLRQTFDLESPYTTSFRGDVLETIPLSITADARDLGFRLNESFTPRQVRLRFIASTFWVTIQGRASDGPVLLDKLLFYGRLET